MKEGIGGNLSILGVDRDPEEFFLMFLSREFEIKLSFATNSDFLIPISLRPNVVDFRYFKLLILLDEII